MIGTRVVIAMTVMLVIAACRTADEDHVQIAEMSNQALYCAALAGASNRNDEAERLHDVGMQLAKRYLAAARSGTLTKRERSQAPDPWKMLGPPDQRGPADERVIGTLQHVALKRAMADLNAPPDSDAEKKAAAGAFAKAGCEGVGR
jgi:DICT domain-containing protein